MGLECSPMIPHKTAAPDEREGTEGWRHRGQALKSLQEDFHGTLQVINPKPPVSQGREKMSCSWTAPVVKLFSSEETGLLWHNCNIYTHPLPKYTPPRYDRPSLGICSRFY